jgi:hypothetical protein
MFITLYIPLTPSGKSRSDLAEIFSMTSFNLKKYLILYYNFLSCTVKNS